MTVSTTSRLGITRWDSGGDPFTRAQMDDSHQALEDKVAGYSQAGTRPTAAAAYTGFFHFNSTSEVVSYCDGTDWYEIGVPGDSVENLDGTTSSVGTSVQFAREDHVHAISAGAIGNTQLATDSVSAAKIQANAVTQVKINNGAVSNDKLGSDISAAKLVTGTLSMDRIAAGAITDAKLASGIDAAKLTGTLSADRIASGSLSLAKIANSAALSVVGRSAATSGVVADIPAGTDGHVLRRSGSTLGFGQIVGAGIANDAIDSQHYADGSIDTAHIADGQITLVKMAADSVDSDQYVDGSIDRVHLAADIVDGTKIADDSINSEHYVDGSIDTAHIADNQVTVAKIEQVAAHAILARVGSTTGNLSELAAGSDSVLRRDGTGNLAFGTLDRNHIADGEITDAKIASVSGSKITGTVAAANIDSAIATNAEVDAEILSSTNKIYGASTTTTRNAYTYHTIFVTTSTPSTTGIKTGDIWMDF